MCLSFLAGVCHTLIYLCGVSSHAHKWVLYTACVHACVCIHIHVYVRGVLIYHSLSLSLSLFLYGVTYSVHVCVCGCLCDRSWGCISLDVVCLSGMTSTHAYNTAVPGH